MMFQISEGFACFIFLALVRQIKGDASCWDGTNAVDYTGTLAETETGRQCQAWASDSPHTHTFHGGSPLFPHDGDDVAASNYCRDPDGTAGTPYCFTTDPTAIAEACSVPLCYNSPCTDGLIAGVEDPTSVAKAKDSGVGLNYVIADENLKIPCCGTVSQWRIYAGLKSDFFSLQIWRRVDGIFELIGENIDSSNKRRYMEINVLLPDRIAVQEGDYMGWYGPGQDILPYQNVAGLVYFVHDGLAGAPTVGDVISVSDFNRRTGRLHSIGAVLANSIAPRFTNADTTLTLTTSQALDITIYTLLYTDDDPVDVATLTISMDTSAYFALNDSSVYVHTLLTAGTHIVTCRVEDRCGLQGLLILTVTVEHEPLSITSLPTTASIPESTITKTLVQNVTITPTGSFTCTLDDYSPVRAEGNPFVIENMATDEVGIYLKSAANIRHGVIPSYNVTVTCTHGDSLLSDTSYVIINVDQNSAPVFSSFQAAATIGATTALNSIVYTANIADDEADPVVMALECDPTPCPFLINNDGEIHVTADLQAENQPTYTWILTADDGYSTVQSSNISVIVTGLGAAPVITNLDHTESILENLAAGVVVYQVSQTDVNVGDSPVFQASFPDMACSAMYDIDPTDGRVTSLVALDFETDSSCDIVVVVFDGLATSNPGTLTVDISDVDEPPVLSNTGYVITTVEVADGTALPSASIGGLDPEGTAVTLTIDCGADSGYLTIDATSGIVTMATAFDLEGAGLDTYTIACVVTGTDATAETSTATLNVIVQDGNDVAPVFADASYIFYVTEGQTGINVFGRITATDGDRTSPNNAVTYTLVPTTDFSIGGDGSITNKADISGATAGTSYTVTATATDGGTPSLTGNAAVEIRVLSAPPTTTKKPTATSGGGSSGSSSGDSESKPFFSELSNILLLAIGGLVAVIALALAGCFIYRCCCAKQPVGMMGNNIVQVTPNQTQAMAQKEKLRDYPKKKSNLRLAKQPNTTPRVKPIEPLPEIKQNNFKPQKPNNVSPIDAKPSPQTQAKQPDSKMTSENMTSPRRSPPEYSRYDDRPESGESGVSIASGPLFRHSPLDSYRKQTDSPRSPANINLRMIQSKDLNGF